jgi:hypothetical protein
MPIKDLCWTVISSFYSDLNVIPFLLHSLLISKKESPMCNINLARVLPRITGVVTFFNQI